jgi:hypothetical protein
LPDPVLRWLERDEGVTRLASRVEEQLAAGGISRPWWLDPFNVWPLHLDVCDTWPDRVRYVGRALVTPDAREWALIKVRLPAGLFPLYFLLRPPRRLAPLVREGVARALRGRRP